MDEILLELEKDLEDKNQKIIMARKNEWESLPRHISEFTLIMKCIILIKYGYNKE